jgi:hypothetical protein
MTILIPPQALNILRTNQVSHNPMKISALLGAIGMNAGLRDARIGLFTSHPVAASRPNIKTIPMKKSTNRS